MFRFRTFRNDDPPFIARFWNETFQSRGAVVLHGPEALEDHLFANLCFDPKNLILAEKGDELVGLALVCLGANEQRDALDPSSGSICMLGTHPSHRGQGVGTELLRRSERRLESLGAQSIYAGPTAESNPVLLGLYGGSQCSGFLASEGEQLIPFFEKRGYATQQKSVVLQCRVEQAVGVVDARFFNLRRKYQLARAEESSFRLAWVDACAFGPIDIEELCLTSKDGSEQVGSLQWWDMDLFSGSWKEQPVGLVHVEVLTSLQRKGLARFLLAQFLQRIDDLCFSVVEAHVGLENVDAQRVLQSVGFSEIDQGLVFERI